MGRLLFFPLHRLILLELSSCCVYNGHLYSALQRLRPVYASFSILQNIIIRHTRKTFFPVVSAPKEARKPRCETSRWGQGVEDEREGRSEEGETRRRERERWEEEGEEEECE